ncbi:MAG: cation:proton antiporter [Clostridia bacterium]|nr:cation:proton antiporter [Clostridia bacterium]
MHWMDRIETEGAVLLSLGLILMLGFASTRVTKKLGLPNVSGYIVCGILIGPHLIGIIPQRIVDSMGFVSDIALAFIAFGVGRFFKKETLQATGVSVLLITVLEAILAGVLVTLSMVYMFHLDWNLALLLGAIATATAPASTVMTINQYHARGEFVDLLLQVVALDDVVCLLVFSLISAIVTANHAGGASVSEVVIPLLFNLGAIVLGVVFALVLAKLLPPSRSKDNRLILAISMLLCLSGICAAVQVSPLLSCMVFGAVFINYTKDKKLFKQVNKFTPPIMILFFVVSGMKLDLSVLGAFGLVGVGYFLVRIAGKFLGAYLGCLFTHRSRNTRRCLGAALVPQAGVAIGLAYLAERILPPQIGSLLVTIILASSVLYELIGPASAKFALFRSGAIKKGEKPVTPSPAGNLATDTATPTLHEPRENL